MGQYLIHHGVQGMKWGVMHGPPYPLTGENKKAFKEDRKKFFKAEKEHRQTLSKSDREAYDRQAKGHAMNQYSKHWEAGRAAKKAGNKDEAKKEFYKGEQYRDYAMKYDKRNRSGTMISKLMLGGAIGGAFGGAAEGYELYKLGKEYELSKLGKEYDDRKYVNKELKKMIDEMTLNKFPSKSENTVDTKNESDNQQKDKPVSQKAAYDKQFRNDQISKWDAKTDLGRKSGKLKNNERFLWNGSIATNTSNHKMGDKIIDDINKGKYDQKFLNSVADELFDSKYQYVNKDDIPTKKILKDRLSDSIGISSAEIHGVLPNGDLSGVISYDSWDTVGGSLNLELTFDPKTGKLKTVYPGSYDD